MPTREENRAAHNVSSQNSATLLIKESKLASGTSRPGSGKQSIGGRRQRPMTAAPALKKEIIKTESE